MIPGGVRARTDRVGGSCGPRVVVNAHGFKRSSEARLERLPNAAIDRSPGASDRINCDLRSHRAGLGTSGAQRCLDKRRKTVQRSEISMDRMRRLRWAADRALESLLR